MHACMHACMHTCMHACMYVCMYVCMYTGISPETVVQQFGLIYYLKSLSYGCFPKRDPSCDRHTLKSQRRQPALPTNPSCSSEAYDRLPSSEMRMECSLSTASCTENPKLRRLRWELPVVSVPEPSDLHVRVGSPCNGYQGCILSPDSRARNIEWS